MLGLSFGDRVNLAVLTNRESESYRGYDEAVGLTEE